MPSNKIRLWTYQVLHGLIHTYIDTYLPPVIHIRVNKAIIIFKVYKL